MKLAVLTFGFALMLALFQEAGASEINREIAVVKKDKVSKLTHLEKLREKLQGTKSFRL